MKVTISRNDICGHLHLINGENGPTFCANIESPNSLPMRTGPARVARLSGWAVSSSGDPVTVKTRVSPAKGKLRGEWQESTAGLSRPDVLSAINQEDWSRQKSDNCGFCVDLILPDGLNKGRVEVEISGAGDSIYFEPFEIVEEAASGRQRSEYKSVWNSVSDDYELAKLAVAGYTDEDRFVLMADATIGALTSTVGLKPDDEVLEIGAGVGRVGPAIAPLVKRWVAADVSENMLKHARERCRDFDNIEYVALSGYDLSSIPDESLDVVSCTVVFMHLDEWDRFGYIQEGMRVLRPGGRMYVDNVNLCGDEGWNFFMNTRLQYHPLDRPANISKTSTAPELETYFQRAGFSEVSVETGSHWIWAWGVKPA